MAEADRTSARGGLGKQGCWRGLIPLGGAVLAALATIVMPDAAAARSSPDQDPGGPALWSRPVPGEVVGAFAPPASPFGAGHRGVDFAAAPGTQVRSAGPGQVVFAGSVAGSRHVVVAHAGGLRTSYSFLATVAVRRGQAVARGDLLGTAGGSGEGHGAGVFHLGLRMGERYLDPMLLFRAAAPADVVRLAPADEHFDAVAEERVARRDLRALVRDLASAPVSAAAAAFTSGASLLGDVSAGLRSIPGAAASGAGVVGEAARFTLGLTWDWAQRDPTVAFAASVGRGVGSWWTERRGCTGVDDLAAAPTRGTGHLLFRVAGLGSVGGEAAIFRLPAEDLGYRDGEVFDFSYAGATPDADYTARDTFQEIRRSAQLLGAQLEEIARRHPGREVDLVAHSQGGIVARAYLDLYYDPSDPDIPPLGRVVTLASPHRGAPLATAAWGIRGARSGARALDALEGATSLPESGSSAVADLREGSELLAGLDERPLPDQIELHTVGAAADVVVPARASTFDEATSHALVRPGGLDDHSSVPSDPAAVRATALALEGRPPPCAGLVTHVEGAVISDAATRFEHGLGVAGRALAEVVDAAGDASELVQR